MTDQTQPQDQGQTRQLAEADIPELHQLRKSDIAFAKREDTGNVFALVNAKTNEWDRDGTFLVKTDGVAVLDPDNKIIAIAQDADNLPDFLEEVVHQGMVWLIFTVNADVDHPDTAFNLFQVLDKR